MASTSVQLTRLKVIAVASVSALYLLRGNKDGPAFARQLSHRLTSRFTAFQSGGFLLLVVYILRNAGALIGIRKPRLVMDTYDPAYARTVRILTAFDAGYWSAMHIQPKWLRDICEMAFSIQYLFRPRRAEEIVRLTRLNLTVDHLRVAWNKPHSKYLAIFTKLGQPFYSKYEPKKIMLARPNGSAYKQPVTAWLYFDGTPSELKNQTKLVLDIPGGGFISMDPRCNDDRLLPWAVKLKCPIISIDYGKAPEFPYPYALNEVYDVYRSLTDTRGRCIGMSGDIVPRMILSGDSAGGNLATALSLKILDTRTEKGLMMPEGLMLVYPGLQFDAAFWLTMDETELLEDSGVAKHILRERDARYTSYMNKSEVSPHNVITSTVPGRPLQLTAAASFVNDLILTPDMMWAMITMYIGPKRPANFETDYCLQPLIAPDEKLAQLPKIYILTGDRDPLVDDSIRFASRVRRAKKRLSSKDVDPVHLELIPGYSHGFMQFLPLLPEARPYVPKTSGWIESMFEAAEPRK